MQIRYTKTGKVEHVPNNIGRVAINSGWAEEVVVPEKPKAVPNLKWAAHAGPIIGDFQHCPRLAWSCSTCGKTGAGFAEGPTVHLTTVVRHCGVAESCPSDVAKRFVELRKAYDARKKKRRAEYGQPTVVIDALTSAARARAGLPEIKTRAQLIDEALRIAKIAPVKA